MINMSSLVYDVGMKIRNARLRRNMFAVTLPEEDYTYKEI